MEQTACGYPDSKIVVIIPAHYLSKDKDHVFPDLIHKAFEQKPDEQVKRFYDDRLTFPWKIGWVLI